MSGVEELGSNDKRKYRRHYVLSYAIAISLGSFQFGYNLTISTAYMWIKETESILILMTTLIPCFSALVSCVISGRLAERVGRRKFLIIANLILLLSLPLLGFFPIDENISMLLCHIFGRILFGLAAGIFGIYVPMFLKEIAPNDMMGRVGVFHQLMICIGNLTSVIVSFLPVFCFSYPYDKSKKLDLSSFAFIAPVPGMIALLQLILLLFIYTDESPRFLIMTEDLTACEEAIKNIYPIETERSKELFELKLAKEDEKFNFVRWKDLFCSKLYKNAFYIGCLIIFIQQITGINSVFLFSGKFISKNNSTYSPLLFASLSVGVMNFVGTVTTFFFIDKIGRRRVSIIGSIILIVAFLPLIIMSAMLPDKNSNEDNNSMLMLIPICIFAFGFGFSYGPVCWLYLSEIAPTRGVIFGNAIQWISAIIIPLPLQFIHHDQDIYYPIIFGVHLACVAFSLFFFKYIMKETCGLYPRSIKYLYAPPGAKSLYSSTDSDPDTD